MNIMEMPLKNSVAHDETNMVRAKLHLSPEESYLKPKTGEEYDEALAVVEAIKRMAEAEPLSEKVLYEIARLATKSFYGILKAFYAINNGSNPISTELKHRAETRKIDVLEVLEDAAMELRKLKAEARKFENK